MKGTMLLNGSFHQNFQKAVTHLRQVYSNEPNVYAKSVLSDHNLYSHHHHHHNHHHYHHHHQQQQQQQ